MQARILLGSAIPNGVIVMSSSRLLPSLEALRYFEAAARHLSFTRASQDLFLTQSAVSQKIQALEQHLGYPLFHRLPRGLRLTSRGERLYTGVAEALGLIGATLHQIGDEALAGTLKVRVMPSFATKWLLPRLAAFNQAFPDIQLQVDADLALPSFKGDEVDLAVTSVWTDDARLAQRHLFEDLIYPVASPALLERCALHDYRDLAGTTLLHDSMPHAAYSTNWDAFLSRQGRYDIDTRGGSAYSRADLVLQAACSGQGVALMRHSLCADDLRQGTLVRPFADVQYDGHVWLVCPHDHLERPRIKAFGDWLLAEVASHLQERRELLGA